MPDYPSESRIDLPDQDDSIGQEISLLRTQMYERYGTLRWGETTEQRTTLSSEDCTPAPSIPNVDGSQSISGHRAQVVITDDMVNGNGLEETREETYRVWYEVNTFFAPRGTMEEVDGSHLGSVQESKSNKYVPERKATFKKFIQKYGSTE